MNVKQYFAVLICLCGISETKAQQTLDYFLKTAVSNSPLLKDIDAQIQSLSLDSQLIRAALKTQVNGFSNNYYAPIIHGYGYDDAITNGAQLQAMVQVSRNIPGRKAIETRMQNLQIQSSIAGNTRAISGQDLKKTVTDQYIVTYGEQIQLQFTDQVLQLLRSEDSILKVLTRQNVYKQTDYLSFAVVLRQQELLASQLHIQYTADYMTLNYLAGVVDSSTTSLKEPGLNPTQIIGLSQSIFYRQFELDSLRLENEKRVAALAYRPSVNIFADGGYNSSLAYRAYRNWGTSAGINLSIPIYDGRQKRIQYAKIDIQERSRQTKKDFFQRQYDQQVAQLWQQLASTDKVITQINTQVRYTETLIRSSEKLLATGDIRITDFIISLSNFFTAKNLLAQNHVSRLQILSQLTYWNK